MKKIIKISLVAASVASLVNVAEAATPGSYLGAGLGYSQFNTPHNNLITGGTASLFKQSHNYNGFAGRAFAGYNLTENFGFEGGISQFARARYESKLRSDSALFKNTKDFTMTSLDLVGKAYLPVGTTGLNLYALGGAALVHSKIKQQTKLNTPLVTGFDSTSQVQNKFRPKFGAGASYDIPQTQLTTNLEWSRIQGKGNTKKSLTAIPTADMVTVDIAYKFD